MGVLIDTNRRPSIKIDVDTIMVQSAVDAALAEYLQIITELGAGTVIYASKIGDHQFKDIDDADDSDIFQITADDADGGIKQSTSQITDGNIWEMAATGTISGASASATIDYIHLDLDALVLNDAATNAITLQGIDVDFNGLTATAVGISLITGITVDMPNVGIFSSETGLVISAIKNAVANNAVSLDISRNITGDLGADAAISNYAATIAQVSTNDTTGDFDLTDEAASGLLTLQMSQSDLTSAAKTDQDLMRGTALLIDIDAISNHAEAKLDMSARAIDITYTLAETLGQLRMAATDISRITTSIPDGLTSAGAFEFNMIKLDTGASYLNDANMSFRAIDLELIDTLDTDFAVFYGINIDMPVAYQGTDPTSAIRATGNDMVIDILTEGDFGIELETDVQDLDNALLPIFITKDLDITVAHADGGTLTNSGNSVDITIDTYSLDTTPATNPNNTSAVGLHTYQRHRQGNASDVGNIDEAISGASLDLDQILTINNTNAGTPTIITTAPFIDMDLDVTETAGDVNIGAVDWISLSVDGGNIATGVAVKMLAFESAITLNNAAAEFYGFELNTTGITDTLSQADSVGGISIIDDGILDYGIKAVNASDILKFMDTENNRGIYIDMNTAASTAIITTSDVSDIDNALLIASLSKDLAITSTHAGGAALANSGIGFNISVQTISNDDSGAAAAAHSTTATALKVDVLHDFGDADDSGDFDDTVSGIMIDLDQTLIIDNTAATPTITTTMPFIDMDLAVTETAGDINIGAVDFVSLTLGGGTVASAVAPKGFHIDSNITLDHANAEFYGIYVDTTGMTDTTSQADSVGGISIVDDGILDFGIKLTDAIDILKIMDTENTRSIWLDMNTAAYTGIDIDADMALAANDIKCIDTNRSFGGALDADYQMTNYSINHTIAGNHTGAGGVANEIDMDSTAGIMKLDMTCTTSNTDVTVTPDTFESTALLIDVVALTDTNANAKQDVTARALDINYTLTETLGVLELNTTDIARILLAGAIDDTPVSTIFNMLNIDAGTFTIDDDSITISGLKVDFETLVDTDFEALYGISVIMPAVYQGVDPTSAIHCTGDANVWDALAGDYGLQLDMNEAASTGLYILSDTATTIANAMKTIDTSRDFAGVTTADIAMTNYSVNHNVVNVNTPTTDFDFDFDTGAGVMSLIMQQTNTSSFAKTDPDKFNATCLNIEVDAITITEVNAELDAAPRAIDISFAITETAGTLQLGTTDAARIQFEDLVFSTAGAMTLTGLFIDIPNAETFNDANITFMPINIDCSNITNTSSAWLGGIDVTMGVSADAGLRVTMGATPAVGGIQVVSAATTDISITANGEIVGGNYPEEGYLRFELWEPSNEVNVNIAQVYDATEYAICLDIDATLAVASCNIWCQYIIPDDFKEFPDTSDDISIRAITDAGADVDSTITVTFYDNAGVECSDDSIAVTALTNAWATYDCATVTADGTWAAGDKVMVKIAFALPDADDAVRVVVPVVKYKRSG